MSAELIMPGPTKISVAEARTYVDVGIITMKSEEFQAVLSRMPSQFQAYGKLQYNASKFISPEAKPSYAAIVRTNEQGDISAQATANSLVEELQPRFLILVGIAGAKPELEFTLGDVIVANRMYDFNVVAVNPDKSIQYGVRSAPAHSVVQIVGANLTANPHRYGEWFSEASIGAPRPPVDLSSRNFLALRLGKARFANV